MKTIISILFFCCLSQNIDAKIVTIRGEIKTFSGEKVEGRLDAYLIDYQNDDEPIFLYVDSLGKFEAQVRKRGYYGVRVLSQNYKTHFQYIRFHQRKLRNVSFSLKDREFPLSDKHYFSIIKNGYLIKSSITIDTTLITGKVVDEMNEPVMFANVVLSINDTVFIGTQTDWDGFFSFSNIPPDIYRIEISYVGFPKFTLNDFEIQENGIVELTASLEREVKLDMIQVILNIPIIEQDNLTQGTKFNQWEIQRSPHKN